MLENGSSFGKCLPAPIASKVSSLEMNSPEMPILRADMAKSRWALLALKRFQFFMNGADVQAQMAAASKRRTTHRARVRSCGRTTRRDLLGFADSGGNRERKRVGNGVDRDWAWRGQTKVGSGRVCKVRDRGTDNVGKISEMGSDVKRVRLGERSVTIGHGIRGRWRPV